MRKRKATRVPGPASVSPEVRPDDPTLLPEASVSEAERLYSGRGLEAGALGALRGLTLGLSDAAITGLGIADPSTLAGLRERNRTASLVGEVGSLLAPMGPVGLIGRAARSTLGGGSLVRGAIAAGTAEGAAAGLGQAITEDSLGSPGMNAEGYIAHVGLGAVLGGATAGALGLTAEGLRRAKVAIGRGVLERMPPAEREAFERSFREEVVRDTPFAAGGTIEPPPPPPAAPGVPAMPDRGRLVEAFGLWRGPSDAVLDEMASVAGLQGADRDAYIRLIRETIDGVNDVLTAPISGAQRDAYGTHVRAMVEEGRLPREALEEAAIDEAIRRDLRLSIIDPTRGILNAGPPVSTHDPVAMRDLREVLDGLSSASGDDVVGAARPVPKGTGVVEADRVVLRQSLQDQVDARRLTDLDRRMYEAILDPIISSTREGRARLVEARAPRGAPHTGEGPAHQTGDVPALDAEERAALDRVLGDIQDAVPEIEAWLSGEMARDAAEQAAGGAIRRWTREGLRRGGEAGLGAAGAWGVGVNPALGGALGFLGGRGILGQGVRGGVDAILDSMPVRRTIDAAADAIVHGTTPQAINAGPLWGAARRAFTLAGTSLLTAPRDGETEHEALERLRTDLDALAADQSTVGPAVSGAALRLGGGAPAASVTMQDAVRRNLLLLHGALPRAASDRPVAVRGLGDRRVPETDLRAFRAYAHGVMDPLGAIVAVAEGRAGSETVRALGAAYPELTGALRSGIADRMARDGRALDWRRRRAIAAATGGRLDPSADASIVRLMQAPRKEPEPPARKKRELGARSEASEAQRLAGR